MLVCDFVKMNTGSLRRCCNCLLYTGMLCSEHVNEGAAIVLPCTEGSEADTTTGTVRNDCAWMGMST